MEVRVKPERILYFNEESFFGIYGCQVHPDDINLVKVNKWGTISIKGVAPKLNFGEEYIVTLKEDTKSQYEGSYIIESIRQDKPQTVEEQRAFLETILTPTQVANIFEVYEGQDVVSLIQNDEFDYTKVKGLGDKTYEKLRNKVMENIEMSEVLAFLGKYGIKYNMIQKLIKEYKNPQLVIQKIEENPYLLTEVKGIGFKTADAIAKAMGYDMTSDHRIDSCIRHVIGEENANGHSWVDYKTLLNRCIEYLVIDKSYIQNRLQSNPVGVVVKDGGRYTTRAVYNAEKYIAMRMIQFKTQSKQVFTTEELDEFLDNYCKENGVELEENQRKFFYDWNNNNILFLIGGGGMGKSWLQRILLELVAKKNLRVALLAPTGKASKVMQGYTGKPASTIHRKIGVYDNEEEASGEITEDVIIVDESSMCDVFILAKFFKAIVNPNARILFVGDDFQLPSVGVGNFLYDSIHSNCITISRLKKVFRQADGGILNVSTDVREGKKFLNDNAEGRIRFGKDCVFHLVDQEFIRDGYIHYYKKVLEKYDVDDIVILSPTKKGKLGTAEINKEIQKIVNPASPDKKEKTFGRDFPVTFRVGDSVMNTVNTYGAETVDGGAADIFNGDTGKIVDINEEEKVIIVDFEGIKVKMKFDTVLNSLVHSYALTIHKSQGSQYSVVIVIIDKSMTYQLNANLIYTGFSRAKKYMLVLGQAKAINNGIKKFANMERRSFLQELLNEYNEASVKPIDGYKEPEEIREDCIA